jgi:hypothetical protein
MPTPHGGAAALPPMSPNDELRIIRLPKVGHYVRIDNDLFRDRVLSWEARGLMGYLLSKPDNWKIRMHDLLAHGPAGEFKLRRMLKELQRAGYMSRRRIAHSNGTFEWETLVYETPAINGEGHGRSALKALKKPRLSTRGSSTRG